MAENKKSGKEILEDVLRGIATRTGSGAVAATSRMQAALALAVLERGALDGARSTSIRKIINGSAD